VLLFCETGMVLYRSDAAGQPLEDKSYGPFPGNTQRFLKTPVVDQLVAAVRAGMRRFYTDLKNDPSMLEEGNWIHGLAERW